MRILLGITIGAAIGFAKCASGICPLTRSPWISMVVGGLIGLMMVTGK